MGNSDIVEAIARRLAEDFAVPAPADAVETALKRLLDKETADARQRIVSADAKGDDATTPEWQPPQEEDRASSA